MQDNEQVRMITFCSSRQRGCWADKSELFYRQGEIFIMLRTALSTIAPRATAASRSLAARRSPITSLAVSSAAQGGRSLALESVAAAATATRSASERRCSWRNMSSTSAKVATAGGGDSGAMQGEGGEVQGEMGTGRDARDPVTGEGIWMDEEDEVGLWYHIAAVFASLYSSDFSLFQLKLAGAEA